MVGCVLTATSGCVWKNETTKKCIAAAGRGADSGKRFDDDDDDDDDDSDDDDDDETGNPYLFDSDETGA